MNEFEKLLERTEEVRNQKIDINEQATSLSNIIGIKIRGILEGHQKEIMAFDEKLREQIKKGIRERLEKIFTDVEDYPKGMDL